jgi:hypothetical protein
MDKVQEPNSPECRIPSSERSEPFKVYIYGHPVLFDKILYIVFFETFLILEAYPNFHKYFLSLYVDK